MPDRDGTGPRSTSRGLRDGRRRSTGRRRSSSRGIGRRKGGKLGGCKARR